MPRDALLRQSLLDRLHGAIGAGLTVVQAPAGFGKTTLVASFALEEGLGFAPVWMTVDGTCRTRDAFAERLAQAVLAGDAWAPVSITLGEDYRSYLAGVFAHWQSKTLEPPLVILDSLEELGADAPAWSLIEWLAEFLVDGGELVLISREPIQRRALDRRFAGGDAVLFGPADLAFTPGEVEQLCAGRSLSFTAKELYEATGGWPIAVMGILRGAIPWEAAHHALTDNAWERYLVAEVWRGVPPELREALLRLAVLPACDGEVGRRLVGEAAWEATLRWAREAGFLVESQEDGALRFNPLLREFLRREFRRTGPEEATRAVRDAVRAYLDTGNPTLALATATELRAAEDVVTVVRERAGELIDRGAFDLLTRAFAVVPTSTVEEDALLRALRARSWSLGGDARAALVEARALLDDEHVSTEARFHALLAAVRAARLLGRSKEALSLLDEAERLRPSLHRRQRLELDWYRAHTLMALVSDFDEAERLLRGVEAQGQDAPVLSMLALSALGQLAGMRGDAAVATRLLTEAARGWRAWKGLGNLPWVLNNLSMAYLAAGDTASAIEAAKEARAFARQAKNDRAVAYAVASLGDALLAAGNVEGAREAYRDALRLCEERVTDDALAAMVVAGLAAAARMRGDLAEADLYAKRANLIADALGSPYETAVCRLQAAGTASMAGDHAAALALSAEATELARRTGADGLLRVALFRQASCAFRAGRRSEAAALLRTLGNRTREPWQAEALSPVVREDPLFAQWAAGRPELPAVLRERLRAAAFQPLTGDGAPHRYRRYPEVRVESLGRVSIFKDGERVPDEAFASARAVEFFLLFLARPAGLRKEEAVVELYPDLSPGRCNSAFHSNLYRVRRALYQECIVKRGETYVLNPEGSFDWDVARFREAIARARAAPAGSKRRAELFEAALQEYRGPFATTVRSEWAAALRAELDSQAVEALASLAGFHAARGDFEEAAGYLERVLATDPLNDEAAFYLARFRAQSGNTMAALAVIDRFGELLRQELGEELPERLRKLRRAIATGAAV